MLGIRRIYRDPTDARRWRWAVYYAVGIAESVISLLGCSVFKVNWQIRLLSSSFMWDRRK